MINIFIIEDIYYGILLENRYVFECVYKKFYLVDVGDLDVFGIIIMLFLFGVLDIYF